MTVRREFDCDNDRCLHEWGNGPYQGQYTVRTDEEMNECEFLEAPHADTGRLLCQTVHVQINYELDKTPVSFDATPSTFVSYV